MAVFPVARLRLAWLRRSAEYRHALEVIEKSELFDADFYKSQDPEVKRLRLSPIAHYVAWGASRGLSPNTVFSPEFYRQRHGQPESANDLVQWLEHGARQGYSPHPLFDVQFYLRNNPGVAATGLNPLAHFLKMGGRAGRDPHPLFDTSYYLESNPDVARSGGNALVHYLGYGRKEGRAPHPLFIDSFYCAQNLQVSRADGAPLLRYLLHGADEDYAPHPLFDGTYYLARYSDVKGTGLNPLAHYTEFGSRELRDPHPLFDAKFYCAQISSGIPPEFHPLLHYIEGGGRKLNPHPLFDTSYYLEQCSNYDAAQMTPLEHYLCYGGREGKNPHPLFDSSFYLAENPDVMESGVDPLVHYLKYGARAGRCPNPRFDPVWYCERYPEVVHTGMDPLVHYVRIGAAQGKDPHPQFQAAWYVAETRDLRDSADNPLIDYLRFGRAEGRLTQPAGTTDEESAEVETIKPFFDVPFYIEQCREFEYSDTSPYQHYLAHGAKERKDPHPLFNTGYYLDTNPEVAASGVNPLLHFVQQGGAAGRDPHPLFDASFYLERYVDVARLGVNPLVHYIRFGYAEGRWPNPMFDTAYYLRSNQEVRDSQVNPLVHFIQCGATQGRNPHPAFDLRLYLEHHPALAQTGTNPLIHYLHARERRTVASPLTNVNRRANPQPGRYTVEALNPSAESGPLRPSPTILCVSHVPPYPPRAGNEYAEYRQLDCLQRHGYRIVLLFSPLPGAELSAQESSTLCGLFPYSVVCGRDGLLQHNWPDGRTVLNALQGVVPEPIGPEIGEDLASDESERSLIRQERIFCPDFLGRLALHLESALSPCIVLSHYIFNTRFLPLMRSASLKVIQTHDMFSTKQRKVVQFGIDDALSLTPQQERLRLLRADLILACQRAEAREFAALVPERQVLEVPFDFDVVCESPPLEGFKVFYVASDNSINTKGLRDFLTFAWPTILREAPGAELWVAGKVCDTVKTPPEKVRLLGPVGDLTPWYQQAKVTINPSVAGTGMKIKTAESLSQLRPAVCWPSGIDGFPPELAALCLIARNWQEFAAQVIAVLRSPAEHWFTEEQQLQIRHLLAPNTIYAPMLKYFETYCEQNVPFVEMAAGGKHGK